MVFGTRPEAIKMALLAKELEANPNNFICDVCVTAQHREMLDQVLGFFQITPKYDLNLMRPGQNLSELTCNVLTGMRDILESETYDWVFVHGDTTTSFAASLAAFYAKTNVAHVEAGLRTYDKYSPFPEEINRQLTGRIADYHFAPTEAAKLNLQREHIPADKILVAGNTVIDSLLWAVDRVEAFEDEEITYLRKMMASFTEKKIILVTGHRRENFGNGFTNICEAIREIALNTDVEVIYPVHLNPNVQAPVYAILDNISNIHLIKPLSYPAFVWLMKRAYIILTDSGGIQEEAPSLGKPVLVLRDNTERPEAVEAGTVKLVGTNKVKIIAETNLLLSDESAYEAMIHKHNPYGDGKACKRIVSFLNQSNV